MPKSVDHFIAGVQRSLDLDIGKGQSHPATVRKLGAILDQCGWKKRSAQRLLQLEDALARAGLFADQELTDMGLGLDTRVWFTLEPKEPLGRVFRQERALGYHLGKYRDRLEEALSELAPLTHYYGGNKKEKDYYLGADKVRPDLVFRASNGAWLVCEVEKGDPELESVPQLDRYLQAVRATGKDAVGALVTAKPRTKDRETYVRSQLVALSKRGEQVTWIWYDVAVSLEVAFG